MNELKRVARASQARDASQKAWEASLRTAIDSGHTFAEVAEAASITRARVAQIVGATGKPRGRRPELTESTMRARLEELDGRWDHFIDALKDRYMPAEDERRSEQAYRNGQNARAKRQAAGVTRTGKKSGSSAWKSTVRPTVTDEARRFAETFALRYLEQNGTHPICVKILRELGEAATLREKLEAIDNSRVPFLHD